MPRDTSRIFWENASARLAARINLAVWLEAFAPVAFCLCTAAAIAVYALRRTQGAGELAWLGLIAAAGLAAFVAWRRSRNRRYGATDARVLLESTLRLDARLSAAAAGVGAWPAARRELPAIVQWRSLAAPGWLGAAVLLLLLGAWAPLLDGPARKPIPVEKPPALAETEAILQELSQLKVADPTSLDQLATQVRELADRPAEEQYTHSALEAADALRDQTVAAVRDLSRNFEAGADALAPLDSPDAARDNEKVNAAKEQLGAALNGLRGGRIAGDVDLTASLAGARASLGQLSPQQIKQLRDQLRQAGAQGRGVAGAAGQGANVVRQGEPVGEGEGQGYGSGGVDRGPGDAPLMLSGQLSPENAGRLEGVSTDDFTRAALGELAGTEHGGAHQVDKARLAAPALGGAVAAPAKGGEAAWVDRLAPADRNVLRDFFK